MLNVAGALIVLSGLVVLRAVAKDPASPPKRKSAAEPTVH
jgi:hypothetical protein